MKTTSWSFVIRSVLRVLVAVLLIAVTVRAAFAAGNEEPVRRALVIGNSRYESVAKLRSPVHDARLIARTLRGLGFGVIEARDLSSKQFRRTIEDFRKRAEDADTVVFYYAGRGFQQDGANFLVPVDARLEDGGKLAGETLALGDVIETLRKPKRQMLVFLDASGENPKAKANGLARIEKSEPGLYLAFAAQPGNVTLDGAAKTSAFARALAEFMPTPGISVAEMMTRVRNAVVTETKGAQIPWEQSALEEQVYFNPPGQERAASEETVAFVKALQELQRKRRLRQVEGSASDVEQGDADPTADPVATANTTDIRPLEQDAAPHDEATALVLGGEDDPAMPDNTVAEAENADPVSPSTTTVDEATAAEDEQPPLELSDAPDPKDKSDSGKETETAAAIPAEQAADTPVAETQTQVTASEPGADDQDQAGGQTDGADIAPVDAPTAAPQTELATDEVTEPAVIANTTDTSIKDNEITSLVRVDSPDAKPAPDNAALTDPSADQTDDKVAAQTQGSAEQPVKDYTADIQKELKRLKCLRGTADGKWGKKSASALVRYFRQAGREATQERDAALLDVLRSDKTTSCGG